MLTRAWGYYVEDSVKETEEGSEDVETMLSMPKMMSRRKVRLDVGESRRT